MRRILVIALAAVMGVATVVFAYDIQVSCAPGLRVYLDDTLVGLSSAREDGLFLTNVPRGVHTVRVEKDGFEPQEFQVEIGLPVEVRVHDFVPLPEATPESEPAPATETARAATKPVATPSLGPSPSATEAVGEAPPEAAVDAAAQAGDAAVKPRSETGDGFLGTLIVTSAPQNCEVEIVGRKETKSAPSLTIGDLPAGEHTISFSKDGYEPISGKVVVRAGDEVSVRGNLRDGRVEVGRGGRGALRIITEPERCTVYFRGKRHQKSFGRLNLTHIPPGRYPLVVTMGGRRLASMVEIVDGERTLVEVSFMKGEEPFVVTREPR